MRLQPFKQEQYIYKIYRKYHISLIKQDVINLSLSFVIRYYAKHLIPFQSSYSALSSILHRHVVFPISLSFFSRNNNSNKTTTASNIVIIMITTECSDLTMQNNLLNVYCSSVSSALCGDVFGVGSSLRSTAALIFYFGFSLTLLLRLLLLLKN